MNKRRGTCGGFCRDCCLNQLQWVILLVCEGAEFEIYWL